jgi:hypothetical protein
MTVTWWDGAAWVVYPVLWCGHCKAPRPHHGPYCCSCGTDAEEACCSVGRDTGVCRVHGKAAP